MSKRYQTAQELRRDLYACLRQYRAERDACFDQIEQIFKDCKLDDSDLDGAVFYLVEETGDQRCRLVFTRFSQDAYMSCTGNCKGYLLDGYTDEFSKTASWRPFFQKRSFEMYTA